jgi:uncharacterized Zn finger protein
MLVKKSGQPIRPADRLLRMTETLYVECPGCGEKKRPITTHHGTVGIHCSCGVASTADIEEQKIGEW